jgi:hypothetical protein
MKSGSKKCYACGKMTQTPYKYTIVPSRKYGTIPVYNKAAAKERPNREDLTGDKKVSIFNYCDTECYEKNQPKISKRTYAFQN